MRNMHQVFTILTAVLFIVAELLAVINIFFNKNQVRVDVFLAWLLPLAIVAPLVVAVSGYIRAKRAASVAGANAVDWPLMRFLWTLLVLIFYSTLIVVMVILLRPALYVRP